MAIEIDMEAMLAMSDTEFAALYERFQIEYARRSAVGAHPLSGSVRVAIQMGSYNQRRYSRPWIGVITSWPVGGKPEIKWGCYVGDESGGELEIMAQPGDVIRHGQKDLRGNGSESNWAVVTPDGSLRDVDAAEARKLYGGKK